MKQNIFIGSFLVLGLLGLSAAPIEFDFKDPKGVNNVVFKTDAPLESINGTGTGISGKVTFDPQNPAATKGKIVLLVSSLRVPNSTMQEHLLGRDWMNATEFPEIIFEIGEVQDVKTEANVTTASIVGKLTVKGVTKSLTTPVKMTYLKDKLKARQGKDGDLLVVRTSFNIKRSDFGINASKGEEKVSDLIELSLSLAGSAPRS